MSEILRIKLELGTWLSRGFILVNDNNYNSFVLVSMEMLTTVFPAQNQCFPETNTRLGFGNLEMIVPRSAVNLFPRDRWRNVGDDVRGGFLLAEKNAKRKEKVKNGRSNGNLGQLYLYRSNARVNIARSRILGYSSEPTSENPS